MPNVTIQNTTSVGASSTVENIIAADFAAQRYVRPPFHAMCTLMANISALDLDIELFSNGRAIMDQSTLRVAPGAQQMILPDDMLIERFYCRMGGQLVLKAINKTAGAKSLNWRLILEESQPQPGQMVSQRGPISVAAGASVQVLTGLRIERPRVNSLMDLFMSASAAGLTAELFVDTRSIAPPLAVNATNRAPINPYDLLISDVECPADKIIEVKVVNPTGGAINFNWRVTLDELEMGEV